MGANRPWVLGTLIYIGVNLERGGRVLTIHTHLFPTLSVISYLSLLNAIAKRTLFLGIKNIGEGRICPLAPHRQVTPDARKNCPRFIR